MAIKGSLKEASLADVLQLLAMGGKTDNLHGPPLDAEVDVVSLADGRFEEPEPRHGGMRHFDQGRTAIVSTDAGPTVMLTSRRMVHCRSSRLGRLARRPGRARR